MEYLMTYGWAILVVIIVGIVLWQSGVFGTGGGGTSGFDKIRVEDYVYSNAGLQVSFENAAGQTIKQVNVNYTGDLAADTGDDTWNGALSASWAPGKEYASNVPTNVALCNTTGAGYAIEVNITYYSEAGLYHTESGTIRGTCE